jgi:hypothetical protein
VFELAVVGFVVLIVWVVMGFGFIMGERQI